jgi:hypothetical protein
MVLWNENLAQQESTRYARKIPLTEKERESLATTPRYVQLPKRSRWPLLIVLAVVVSVIAVAWYALVRSAEDNGPEATFRKMIDARNRMDAQDYVSHTTIAFETPGFIENSIADYEQEWAISLDPELRIVSLDLLTTEDLPSYVVEEFGNISGLMERVYSIDVEDYCGIHYKLGAASGGGAVMEGNLPLYKIDSVWYVDLFFDPWDA